jgi:hypothetical protein
MPRRGSIWTVHSLLLQKVSGSKCQANGLVFRTTTEMVRQQILNFEPLPGTETGVLTDSWFSGWPIISAVKSREDEGFYLISGLKKSRNIYWRDGSKVNLETRAKELGRQHYEIQFMYASEAKTPPRAASLIGGRSPAPGRMDRVALLGGRPLHRHRTAS